MKRRKNKDETWCRKNTTTDEFQIFWHTWCESRDDMPTFYYMRRFIENLRRESAAFTTEI